jgi:hypothetical protein
MNGTDRETGQFFVGDGNGVFNLVGECAEARPQNKGYARREVRFCRTDDIGTIPGIIREGHTGSFRA